MTEINTGIWQINNFKIIDSDAVGIAFCYCIWYCILGWLKADPPFRHSQGPAIAYSGSNRKTAEVMQRENHHLSNQVGPRVCATITPRAGKTEASSNIGKKSVSAQRRRGRVKGGRQSEAAQGWGRQIHLAGPSARFPPLRSSLW